KQLQTRATRLIKGVTFSGPPGAGKTHLARVIAHESGAVFHLVSGPSILSKWLGGSQDTIMHRLGVVRDAVRWLIGWAWPSHGHRPGTMHREGGRPRSRPAPTACRPRRTL